MASVVENGSTFDVNGAEGGGSYQITGGGTQYAWTIFYHGEMYNGLPGVYQTANGTFNPRQQALLMPDLAAVQAGIDAYDPQSRWFDYAAPYTAGGAAVGIGVGVGFLTAGLGDWGLGLLGVDLGFGGSVGVGAASGFTANTATALAEGQSWGNSLEHGGFGAIGGGAGGALFEGAGVLAGRFISPEVAPMVAPTC